MISAPTKDWLEVLGSVFGYEIGNGDPLAAGLGAAAGSYLGNGVGGRW